jgi:2-methylaconitate cis-trans-isomerase PrpF
VAVWQLVDGIQRDMQRLTVQEEGNFVMQKIHRSVMDADSIAVPTEALSHEIILHTHTAQRVTVRFNRASSSIEIQRGQLAPFVPLTTNAVRVGDVVFTEILYADTPGIRAIITIEGEVFEIEEYAHY